MNSKSNRIRALREEMNLKQSEVADAIFVSRSALSTYENGIIPTMATCINMAKYFNVSLDYLLELSNERHPAGGVLSAHFTELSQLAGTTAPTASDVDAFLVAAAQYYRKGAPCGSIPLDAMRGFLSGLQAAIASAGRHDAPATLEAANSAVISALEITKMPAALYEDRSK